MINSSFSDGSGMLVGVGLCFLSVLMLLWFAFFSILSDRANQKREIELEKAPSATLAAVKIVKDDLLYLGRESEIVQSKINKHDCGYRFECLCKTKSGNWFLLKFEYLDESSIDLLPIKVKEAKAKLSSLPSEYKKYFGEVEVA